MLKSTVAAAVGSNSRLPTPYSLLPTPYPLQLLPNPFLLGPSTHTFLLPIDRHT